MNFDKKSIKNIRSDAFNNPNSWFYSCNAATGGENSFLKAWHDKVGGFSGGYAGYTSYYNIMGLGGYNRWNSKWRKYNNIVKGLRKKYGFNQYGALNYPTAYDGAKQVTFG